VVGEGLATRGARHNLPRRDDLAGVQQFAAGGHILTSPADVLAAVDRPADQDLAVVLDGMLEIA
jgi:hypothetical protein